ncbi:hypothetical protein AURDEDRAFT_173012 [Auricularia subglabra TFB-10046 SS5]|uniref:BTB domain-containing protein n=1 Tax=Auricularia subglabra (strain TFB-10046 / SS5) TaxID=717982 RepID=J0LHX7_AURST|nr:hypothetical protein AURDEDRAFT_173012 [Auricularia subglabra TFB-10046 SS5]
MPVSKAFAQSAGTTDLILVSADCVLFFVNSALLQSACPNFFDRLPTVVLADGASNALAIDSQETPLPKVAVPEKEDVLTLVLHGIYGHSLSGYPVDIPDLEAATNSLIHRCAAPIPPFLSLGCTVFAAIVHLARRDPLDAYMLASSFNLEQLAVACSPHLLSYPLSNITADDARRMGPPFFCRLLNLHLSRLHMLQELLAVPPTLHPPLNLCSQPRLNDLERAWAMAGAAIICEATADLPPLQLESFLRPLLPHLGCMTCYNLVSSHITNLVTQWSNAKATI